jgi:hypothetical protein
MAVFIIHIMFLFSFYHIMGEIEIERGEYSQAIENYEKFPALWKDADLDLPEVDGAKQRLAGLKDLS